MKLFLCERQNTPRERAPQRGLEAQSASETTFKPEKGTPWGQERTDRKTKQC